MPLQIKYSYIEKESQSQSKIKYLITCKTHDHDHSPLLTEKLNRKIHDKFVNSAIDAIAHQILSH